ncbi:MAG TPA: endopeptidase La [Longimicrobiales bacterium]|nr:endopeptidase La [Longimicrobiales bacterium]
MTERLTLPVLPLRETVVFPGVAMPISAGRPGTVAAIEQVLDGDRRMFAVCQRENVDEPSGEILYDVGVLVRVIQVQKVRGGLQLLVQGEGRARALEYRAGEGGMLEAVVEPLPSIEPVDGTDPGYMALDAELRDRAEELGRLRGIPAEALTQLIRGIEDPGAFADMVAFYLELEAAEKQELLELLPSEQRMRRVLLAVQRDLVRLEAQQEIQQRVQEELGDKQREMVLREQMKAIQEELGEGEEDQIEELRERIDALELPDEARDEVERELGRLERAHPQSAEHQVIRTYLEWVTELPWGERTEDEIQLEGAERVLEEDHYGLEDVKDRVLEFLAVRKLQMERAAREAEAESAARAEEESAARAEEERAAAEGADAPQPDAATAAAPDAAPGHREPAAQTSPETEEADAGEVVPRSARPEGQGELHEPPLDPEGERKRAKARAVGKGPILLFAGPPGVGKTSIAQSVARALGRKYVRIALGGARDEADIRGHRRTYVGAMPGRIIQGMKQAGTKNPVFLLDEVDKLGVSMQGDPSSALLEVLDPAQNHAFVDHYLGVPFDLSEVLFIATANYADRIPAPLLDRMEAVDFSGYTEREKLEIAKRYLLPRQKSENGLDEEQIQLSDEAIAQVISEYTREAGVRQLERELGKVARKAARKIADQEAERVEIGTEEVRALLGRARVHPEHAATEDAVGVATGMYYTPMGGDIMFVESSYSPGKDGLILTGQLGDVMKESARAALTYARTNHDRLGIPADALKDVEIHVHVPAGAVPKDGPSAGITMATALVSTLSKRAVRNDVAMTGEITLTGRVLPIGGVKEKVLGAYRAGIREVILPSENEADLEDLPLEVSAEVKVHLVSTLGEVLAMALRGASLEHGTLTFPDGGLPVRSGRQRPGGLLLNRPRNAGGDGARD